MLVVLRFSCCTCWDYCLAEDFKSCETSNFWTNLVQKIPTSSLTHAVALLISKFCKL